VSTPKYFILTGDRGVGKTTFCQRLVERAREIGMDVKGLISPAIFEDGKKVGIGVLNLSDNSSRRLAFARECSIGEPNTGRWAFVKESIEWGNQVLIESAPCELLLIDELGILEFEEGTGWQHGFTTIHQGKFQLALVVIRPNLVGSALARWPGAEIIELTSTNEIETRIMQILRLCHPCK
jgi:nucleoside-triphosphatase THEP1